MTRCLPAFTPPMIFQWWYEPPHDKTNKIACAPSYDSDQPGHPPSLIRVFAVRMKKAGVLSNPLSAQRRLWSDWADAQLIWVFAGRTCHFVGFVMRWLIFQWVVLFSAPICSRQTTSTDDLLPSRVSPGDRDETNKVTVHPAKTQISLGIRPVWSESSLCT